MSEPAFTVTDNRRLKTNAAGEYEDKFLIPIPTRFFDNVILNRRTDGITVPGRQLLVRFSNHHGASMMHTRKTHGVEVKPVTWRNAHSILGPPVRDDDWDAIALTVPGLGTLNIGDVFGDTTTTEIKLVLEAISKLRP